MTLSKRMFLFGGLATTSLGVVAPGAVSAADQIVELSWSDLIPDEGGSQLDALRKLGIVQHGEMSTPFEQETGGTVTDKYNGMVVRIPGYLVPLDFDGIGVTAALLVPYFGACVHVPPPPPNQLIFLTTDDPYESKSLFEPVLVTGMFGTAATQTHLAEVGYALSADSIEPYG